MSDRAFYYGLLKRCISALDKNINIAALGVIERCFERIKDKSIIALILLSLNSIFPATKDRALRILEDNYENLNDEQIETFINALEKDFQSVYLCWKNNEPYYNCSDEIGLGDFYYDKEINETANIIDLEYIYKVLSSNNNTFDMTFLENACKLDESMIRKLAYSKIIKNYGKTIDIKKFLIDDENSNVIVGIIQAAFQAWDDFSKDAQDEIIDYFEHQSNKLPVLLLSQSFIESGNNNYNEPKSFKASYLEMWCRITTIYLKKCPVKYIKIDEYKISTLIDQIEQNRHKIDEIIILEFIQSWKKWLEKDVFPNDYGLYIMGFLIRTISIGNRFDLFNELLNCKKTSYLTSHIHHLIENWALLSDQEKNEVHNIVLANRSDAIWIKAIIINSREIPKEMKSIILGEEIDISNIKDFVDILREKDLLEPCLNIFCGYPQPLWWLGYHHVFKKRWDAVIEEILLSDYTDNHSFEIALREFVDDMYNHGSRFTSVIWSNLLCSKKKRMMLFKQLIQVSATQNQNNKKMWTDYFNACEGDELNSSIQTIIDNIEAINYHLSHYVDLFNQFDIDFFFKIIYPKLYNDHSIFTICQISKEIISNIETIMSNSEEEYLFEEVKGTSSQDICKLKVGIIHTIKKLYKEQPPRMLFTNQYVCDTIKKLKIDDEEVKNIIEEHRLLLIEKGYNMTHTFDDHYKLKEWVE